MVLQSENEKHKAEGIAHQELLELQSQVDRLSKENEVLHCFANNGEKIESADKFCVLRPVNDEECIWAQFKNEKRIRVCGMCHQRGHRSSSCSQVAIRPTRNLDKSSNYRFYIQKFSMKEKLGSPGISATYIDGQSHNMEGIQTSTQTNSEKRGNH